ncbi:Nucleotidyltransferase [Ramaria rubella]|nr:Nucleotidyltransferase [Ramaria rubella]
MVAEERALAATIKYIHELDSPLDGKTATKDLNGIDPLVTRKIMQFIGRTRKTHLRTINHENKEESMRSKAMQELQKVSGIGPIKARALVEIGCISVKQLHEDPYFKTLSKATQASLIYEGDMRARVTRQEAEGFMMNMRATIPRDFECHAVGSYRRGRSTSSEINVLILHPSYLSIPYLTIGSRLYPPAISSQPPSSLLQDSVIAPLTKNKIIVSAVSGGGTRWQGIVKINTDDKNEEVLRKAEFYLMPQPSKAAAFLAFTGDKLFNLDCRNRAKQRGLYLNEFGLWRKKRADIPSTDPAVDGTKTDAKTDLDEIQGQESNIDPACNEDEQWEFVETPDEVALLQEIGMAYIVPERRNFGPLANVDTAQKPNPRRARSSRSFKQDRPFRSDETSLSSRPHNFTPRSSQDPSFRASSLDPSRSAKNRYSSFRAA